MYDERMFEHGIRGNVETLLSLDPTVCDRGELEHIVELSARVRGWVDAIDVAVARRVAASATPGFDASPAEVLGRCGRRSRKDAKAAADRAAVCDHLPSFEDALADGTITAGHVDALANATRNLDDAARSELAELEADLLVAASRDTLAEFDKDCRDLARLLAGDGGVCEIDRQKANSTVRRWIDKVTGMWHLHAELDAESGAKLWTAVDAQLDTVKQRDGNAEIPLERLTAVALVEAVGATPASNGDRRIPEVCVHVDLPTLADGLHERSICETSNGIPLPVDTIRRLCCEATIIPIVLGADGEALDVGREQRVANRAQRRALRAMYRTCAHPHCDVAFDHCKIHHVIPWERLGPTDLDNLLPLCSTHHHQVHEGRWRLALRADRIITVHRPDGSHYFTGRTIDRRPNNRTTGGGHDLRPARPPGSPATTAA
jgi:hypothetical protein